MKQRTLKYITISWGTFSIEKFTEIETVNLSILERIKKEIGDPLELEILTYEVKINNDQLLSKVRVSYIDKNEKEEKVTILTENIKK